MISPPTMPRPSMNDLIVAGKIAQWQRLKAPVL